MVIDLSRSSIVPSMNRMVSNEFSPIFEVFDAITKNCFSLAKMYINVGADALAPQTTTYSTVGPTQTVFGLS